jgi:hypothetical protein
VSSTYPLEQAPEALRELADRKAMGKVVVTMNSATMNSATMNSVTTDHTTTGS